MNRKKQRATRDELLAECKRLRAINDSLVDGLGNEGALVDFSIERFNGVPIVRMVVCAPKRDEMAMGDLVALMLAKYLRAAEFGEPMLQAIATSIERGVADKDPEVLVERRIVGSAAEVIP